MIPESAIAQLVQALLFVLLDDQGADRARFGPAVLLTGDAGYGVLPIYPPHPAEPWGNADTAGYKWAQNDAGFYRLLAIDGPATEDKPPSPPSDPTDRAGALFIARQPPAAPGVVSTLQSLVYAGDVGNHIGVAPPAGHAVLSALSTDDSVSGDHRMSFAQIIAVGGADVARTGLHSTAYALAPLGADSVLYVGGQDVGQPLGARVRVVRHASLPDPAAGHSAIVEATHAATPGATAAVRVVSRNASPYLGAVEIEAPGGTTVDGVVMVGKVAPSLANNGVELQPAGSVLATTEQVGSAGWNIATRKNGAANVNGQHHAAFFHGGSTAGTITRTGATTVAYNTSSDAHLKRDLGPVDPEVAAYIVDLVEPRWYQWLEDGGDGPIIGGYIAQTVAELWPGAIDHGLVTPPGDDGGPWMMDVSKITPVVHAALIHTRRVQRELTARLAALEALHSAP